jgi:hypothetical protein
MCMTTDDSQQQPPQPQPDVGKQLEEGRKAFIMAPDVAIPQVPVTEPMGGMPAPEPIMTAPVTAEPQTPPAVPDSSD